MADTTFTDYVQPAVNAAWLNDVNAHVYKVASMAELRALTYTPGYVSTKGYYAAGDGGHGTYWYDSTDNSTADNGGTVIEAAPGGRWKLLYEQAPNVKQFGATGDGTTDDTTALQAALTACVRIIVPDGTYVVTAKLIPQTRAQIIGLTPEGAKLKATSAITTIEYPYGASSPRIQNIRFMGVTGGTAIGVASTAGTLQGYLIDLTLRRCSFDFDFDYGINADLIFADIKDCDFGYLGQGSVPAAGASTFVAIYSHSYPATVNYTNLNTVRNCKFYRCGSLTVAGIDISAGASWLFDSNDWEQGGKVLQLSNVQLVQFTGANWVEGNSATGALFSFGTSLTKHVFDGINISNNTCARIFEGNWGAADCAGLIVRNSSIGKSGSTYVLYDTVAVSNALPANGIVAFYNNYVSGGAAGDLLVTETDFRGGPHSPRYTAVVDTSGSGSIVYCSDPEVTLTRAGTGDITLLTASMALGTSADNVVTALGVRYSGASSPAQIQAVTITTTSIRLRVQASDGTAADGVFSITVYGS